MNFFGAQFVVFNLHIQTLTTKLYSSVAEVGYFKSPRGITFKEFTVHNLLDVTT